MIFMGVIKTSPNGRLFNILVKARSFVKFKELLLSNSGRSRFRDTKMETGSHCLNVVGQRSSRWVPVVGAGGEPTQV